MVVVEVVLTDRGGQSLTVQRHSFLTGGVTRVLTACRQIETVADGELNIYLFDPIVGCALVPPPVCNAHANRLELSGFCVPTETLTRGNSRASDVSELVKLKYQCAR